MTTATEAPTQTQALTPFQVRAMELREHIAGSEPTAIVPRTFAEAQAFASALCHSDLIPQALRENAPNVLMMVLAGAEIHVPPIASMRVFHVMDGVPKLSADGIAATCTRDPSCEYLEFEEMSATRVTWIAKKRGRPEKRLTVTREEMIAAGLYDRKNRDGSPGNHQKYPRQMLNARCKAELCRLIWPDICAGMISAEEIADELGLDVNQINNAIDVKAVEKPSSFAPLPSAQNDGPQPEQARNEESNAETREATSTSKPETISAKDVEVLCVQMRAAKDAKDERKLAEIGARVAKYPVTDEQRAELLGVFTECRAEIRKAGK